MLMIKQGKEVTKLYTVFKVGKNTYMYHILRWMVMYTIKSVDFYVLVVCFCVLPNILQLYTYN